MSELVIEHKHRQPRPRQDTTISLLEAKLTKEEQAAKDLLKNLEIAMVRCGYVRDGIYNSRTANWSGRRDRATVLYWRDGKILFGRGYKKNKKGKVIEPYEEIPAVPVQQMSSHQLAKVANNLAPFLDSLEGSVRHQIEALQLAMETVQKMIDRVEGDPQPSDEPAQMSENLEAPE